MKLEGIEIYANIDTEIKLISFSFMIQLICNYSYYNIKY